jgi:hypothetical protein
MARTAISTQRFSVRDYPYSLVNTTSTAVNCGSTAPLDVSVFSVGGWFKPGLNTQSFITKGVSRGAFNAKDWDLFANGTVLSFTLSNGTGSIGLVSGSPVRLQRWNFMMATWDGTTNANGINIYNNGQAVGTGAATATNMTTSANLNLGGSVSSFGFVGNMTKCFFASNRVISLAEYKAMYYANNFSLATSLWNFSEGSGTTVADSIDGINGAITSGTWTADSPFKPRTAISVNRTAITTNRTSV